MKACKTFDLHETCHHLRLLNGLNGRLMISIVLALWSFGMSSKWPTFDSHLPGSGRSECHPMAPRWGGSGHPCALACTGGVFSENRRY